MNLKVKLLWFLVMLVLATPAVARPPFFNALQDRFKFPSDSAAGKARCAICHTEVPKRNEFGKKVEEELDDLGKLKAGALDRLALLSLTADRQTVGEKLSAGLLPTQNSDKPSLETAPTKSELIPGHSFHPAVVHFPIALMLFATALVLFGEKLKLEASGPAASLSLLGGVLSLGITLPTGIAAWLRTGRSLDGPVLIHLLLAAASTVLMLAAWRLGVLKHPAFKIVLILASLVVGATGHFGSLMVYG